MGKEAGVLGQGPVTELWQESALRPVGKLRIIHEFPFNHQFLVKLSSAAIRKSLGAVYLCMSDKLDGYSLRSRGRSS